ncbi:MAG: hypothetical protein PHF00_10755, partial [Elusimicrobia bacterium]|nr:hypothetical protein [Elusimicrobiota bacterium]
LLVAAYCGLSFFDFCHARIGIQDPVLVFFAAAAVFFMDRAWRGGRTADFVLAFLFAACAPFVKTSGVFVPAALGLSLLRAAVAKDQRIPVRSVLVALAAAAVLLAGLALFWFYPHWTLARRYFMWEVASRKSPDMAWSIGRLLWALGYAAPVPAVLFGAALFRALRQAFRGQAADHLDTLLFSWFFCAGSTLVFSSRLYWRWVYWLFVPLVGIAARELVRLLEPRLRRAPAAALALFLVPLALTDLPRYVRYYRSRTFLIWDGARQVESIVGDSLVSGSGFDDFAANSARLNFISSFDYSRFSDCWQVNRAFPTPEKTPRFVSIYAGAGPEDFSRAVEAFYKGCPEWAARYRVFGPMRHLYPPGADMWFVRK